MSETVTEDTSTDTTDAEVTEAKTADTLVPPQAQPTETPKPAVPEAYTYDMPEGVELDKEAADAFSAFAKEKGLSQEDVKKATDIVVQMQKQQAARHESDVSKWAEALPTDKEFGGEKFAENLGIARRGLEAYGSPELYQILEATGFQYHPAVVRAFYKIGKELAPDTFVRGRAPSSARVDMAKAMFPNQN